MMLIIFISIIWIVSAVLSWRLWCGEYDHQLLDYESLIIFILFDIIILVAAPLTLILLFFITDRKWAWWPWKITPSKAQQMLNKLIEIS